MEFGRQNVEIGWKMANGQLLFLELLILHTFNYTAVTYGYFSLQSSDKNHCPQNKLAIPMMYKFLLKGKAN